MKVPKTQTEQKAEYIKQGETEKVHITQMKYLLDCFENGDSSLIVILDNVESGTVKVKQRQIG